MIWDTFKAQSTAKIMDRLLQFVIESVLVPENMTNALQPIDITANAAFKKHEKRLFSEYREGNGCSKEQLCMKCNNN